MKKIFLSLIAIAMTLGSFAQNQSAPKMSYKDWVRNAPHYTDEFLTTAEAARIAENVMLYQQNTGGWPKNIRMQNELTDKDREFALVLKADDNESTIDNDATTTEIRFMARMYNAQGDERYKESVMRGLDYIFRAQYANGGWPQFYPRPEGYYTHITYNDEAIVNVMRVLSDVYYGNQPYSFVPDSIRQKAKTAFDKGVECILATQIVFNGKPTVWCAQHDEVTLEPAAARAYELPSLSGQESCGIVLLLMDIPNPSQRVIDAIENAVAWFNEFKIEGLKKEYFTNQVGQRDYRMVKADDCPTIWARFYDLETGKPFFCDRDGVKKSDVSEIGHERRTGYGWYTDKGNAVLDRYKIWKSNH
jgi:pectinesterase